MTHPLSRGTRPPAPGGDLSVVTGDGAGCGRGDKPALVVKPRLSPSSLTYQKVRPAPRMGRDWVTLGCFLVIT